MVIERVTSLMVGSPVTLTVSASRMSKPVPTKVIVVLCLIIGATLVIGVVSVVCKIRKGRAERHLAA